MVTAAAKKTRRIFYFNGIQRPEADLPLTSSQRSHNGFLTVKRKEINYY